MRRDPLFIKFVNKKISVLEILQSFSKSRDANTSKAAVELMPNPPDLDDFREELTEALRDLADVGYGSEFIAFVNNYMESSLEEDVQVSDGYRGENVFRSARIKDKNAPWVQGFICYNLSLYIKAFGLDSLKSCKICKILFTHKGKYAVYCSDPCKVEGKRLNAQRRLGN